MVGCGTVVTNNDGGTSMLFCCTDCGITKKRCTSAVTQKLENQKIPFPGFFEKDLLKRSSRVFARFTAHRATPREKQKMTTNLRAARRHRHRHFAATFEIMTMVLSTSLLATSTSNYLQHIYSLLIIYPISSLSNRMKFLYLVTFYTNKNYHIKIDAAETIVNTEAADSR
jgi:hypothetical protein